MRVLIVEDEPIIALLMEDVLESKGHDAVASLSASSDALSFLEKSRPDLMLVDIHLTDGETGCTFAREAHQRWGVSTIFVTGSPAKARKCDDAIGVLVKPFAAEAISAAIAAAEAIKAGRMPVHLPAELELF